MLHQNIIDVTFERQVLPEAQQLNTQCNPAGRNVELFFLHLLSSQAYICMHGMEQLHFVAYSSCLTYLKYFIIVQYP